MATPDISFLNPFREVTSSKQHDTRGLALRSSFPDKLTATFSIFFGDGLFRGFGFQDPFKSKENYPVLEENEKSHLGLLDFATLGIPWAISALFFLVATKLYIPLQKKIDKLPPILESSPEDRLLHFRYRFSSLLLNIIYLPLFLLHAALTLARIAVSLALTVAAFFPILAVHIASQVIRAYKIYKIETLEVIEVMSNHQEGEHKSLKQWLTEHDQTIEDVVEKGTLSNAEQKILFTMNGKITQKGIGDFYLPLLKSNQLERQEGLEDLADLSAKFNKKLKSPI